MCSHQINSICNERIWFWMLGWLVISCVLHAQIYGVYAYFIFSYAFGPFTIWTGCARCHRFRRMLGFGGVLWLCLFYVFANCGVGDFAIDINGVDSERTDFQFNVNPMCSFSLCSIIVHLCCHVQWFDFCVCVDKIVTEIAMQVLTCCEHVLYET